MPEQQLDKKTFDNLTGKKQEKEREKEKKSSSNSQQSNWIFKFCKDILYICGWKVIKSIINYLFTSRKESNEKKPSIKLNVVNKDLKTNTTLAQSCDQAEQQHASTNQPPVNPPPTL